ncbi:hypothetical protein E2553_42945 [Paraburkholderia dipogonis]|uniref:Uncharacterized protein n=1 Tax=Paraburkholderia dipogonis TaxID=1211383 RepID=A0A4Y8MGB9_9BURK|nr:hypothetical protein [Paraburkholderia dipogonis]TFE36501.1 hypothetical protein E2553_42945 [Paraburkholderia dipogonis]
MSQPNFVPPSYPIVQFLVSKGTGLSILAALVTLAGLGYLAFATATPWLYPVAMVGAVVLLVLLLSYVEVLKIIADTLLPKY